MRTVETEPIEQDHESAESWDCLKKGWNSECAENREWGNIVDRVDGYESTENEEEEIDEGDIFYSVFALEDMPLLQKEDPDLADMITGDLPLLRQLRFILIRPMMQRLASAFIWSRLDYCNIVLAGLPVIMLASLQRVMKAAV